MTAKQQIFRVRRNYNQWVNNQTLEDYALRFTAKASRRWSAAHVANTALGAISFLALEAIGAAITLNYGFDNTLAAVLVVGTIIFFLGLPICFYATKYGVDIDLLTRGAGFGYLGSTATSLIYSSFTFIFFALEAAIMAKALELVFGLPVALGYIVSSLIVIPLVFHGITFISRFQLWTQPIWIILQIVPFVFILLNDSALLSDWQEYQGSKQESSGVNIFLFGAAASVMFALVAQIGEQVDFLRFIPEKNNSNKVSWWTSLILAGPGWVIIGVIKILAGSFLAIVALHHGSSIQDASDPTTMYATGFGYITNNSHLALIVAGIFVVISQLKINVTNAYAGSIAWSNFFSRLTHSHPGRVVWLVFNVAIALLLMELGIYHAFESTLSIYAIVAVSWVGALVADLVINKPLGLSPTHIEFKRAHLYDINPVGVGSMVLASFLGVFAYLDFFGGVLQALAHFFALAISFISVPLIAIATKSRFYIARAPYAFSDKTQHVECSVCQNHYEVEDMAHCPAYEGYICSLCCSLDARCQDSCKDGYKFSERTIAFIKSLLPNFLSDYINVRFIQFMFLLSVVGVVTGILLAIIFTNSITNDSLFNQLLSETLWKVFFILMIVAGVISWLFVLAHESRIVAQEESQIQTVRLMEEIGAHEETDKKLQVAKEDAEAANNAKSRYLTGISHELRTPLNTVLGYAQLLEMDSSISKSVHEQISTIKRSGEHLADLIEGLLDISKIEAGRLDIQRNVIHVKTLMKQLVKMFQLQAEEKGLNFIYDEVTKFPDQVIGDEKRIRQILINLLSNAVKFTQEGEVRFSVRYRNQVAEFEISDTGIGIPEDELERIFKPFERVRRPDTPSVMGTGLGLTITRLLTDIMGGEIEVTNNPQGGVTFKVWLALGINFKQEYIEVTPKKISGYIGKKRSIMVVDDDPTHRGLIGDLLSPLGFVVVEAPDASSCLEMIKSFKPDLFLIDRLMPDTDGFTLSNKIKNSGLTTPVIIVSANAYNDDYSDEISPPFDGYIIKPVKLHDVLQAIATYINIEWRYTTEDEEVTDSINSTFNLSDLPEKKVCLNIIDKAEIGHLDGLKLIANQLSENKSINPLFVEQLNHYIKEIKFNKIIDLVRVNTHD